MARMLTILCVLLIWLGSGYASPTESFSQQKLTKGYDYTSGVWQFEGEMYGPWGTMGVSVMQFFGGVQHATTFMLHVYDGKLEHYNDQVVASDIYDWRIHLNVIHNVGEGKVFLFVDGSKMLVVDYNGHANHYFKCGVNTQTNPSSRMESRWRNIKVWSK